MRISVCLTLILLATSCAAAAELGRPTGENIVSPDAKLEWLFTREAAISGGLTEGPAVAPDGSVYFTDIPVGKDGGMIMRFDPITKTTAAFSIDSGKANGLIFDAEGFLLSRGPVLVQQPTTSQSGMITSRGWKWTQWLFTPPATSIRGDARFDPLCAAIGLTEYCYQPILWRRRRGCGFTVS